MKKLLLIAVNLAACIACQAATYEEQIDEFFAKYREERYEEAIRSVYRSNRFVDQKPDVVQDVTKQMVDYTRNDLGKLQYVEKIGEAKAGEVAVHVIYLVVYERQVLRFEFQFHRTNVGWVTDLFGFDSEFDEELQVYARKRSMAKAEHPQSDPH